MTQPDSAATRLQQLKTSAMHAWSRGALAQARQDLLAVLALAPADAQGAKMLAIVEQRLGDHAQAITHFRQALATAPDDVDTHTGLAISLAQQGDAGESIDHFRQAARLRPDMAPAWANLGEALARQNRFDEAADALQHAVTLDANALPARLALARVQAINGDTDGATGSFRAVLARQPDNAEAWFGLSYLNTAGLDATDAQRLQHILARGTQPPAQREKLLFAQAKALENTHQYDEAFAAFTAANALGKQRVQWRHAAQQARNRAIEKTFAASASTPAPASPAGEILFIASLPRSGSTLVEAILAAHPDVESGNETRLLARVLDEESHRRGQPFPDWTGAATDADWSRLGQRYMTLASTLRTGKARFVDKSLLNWQLVGAALSMLPDARVVFVQRDAVETCLACYRQCLGPESGFACDLDWLADQYAACERLTRLWRQQYPQRTLHLAYETLVQQPEASIRALLAFCQLPFDPCCLTYYTARRAVKSLPSTQQVRQPLRRDTAKSHLYADHLAGLRRRLQTPEG
ncbi:MAG TPA: sulfotransferase [Rhodanobacteraceae bacterium]